MTAPQRDSEAACLAGGGECGALLRGRGWTATPLGPVADWPAPLRAAVSLVLASPFPTFLFAGPEFTLLYNDASLPLLGPSHPAGLGRPAAEAWPELWARAGVMLADVFATGRPAPIDDVLFAVYRDGYVEELFFSFGFTPIRNEGGAAVLGVFAAAHEAPDQVLGRRRAARLRQAVGNGHPKPTEASRPSRRRPRVLLAADNADTRTYLAQLLGERYDVEALADGPAAVEAARRSPPDLLLLDAALPRLDGPGVLQALRAEVNGGLAPAILLCARGDDARRLKGAGGADDCLVKPFGARELLTRVEAHLKIDRLRRDAAGREAALRGEAEARQRLLARVLAGVSDAIAALDRDWRYTYANPRAAELSGLAVGDMLGRTIWELYPAVVGTEMEAACRRAVETGDVQRFEYYFPPHARWYEQRLYPTSDGLTIFSTDITATKSHEDALRESQDQFRQLAEAIPQFVWVADAGGRMEYINQHWCRFTGLSVEETKAKGEASVIHPGDLPRVREEWAKAAAAVRPYEIELRVRRAADGAYRWMLVRAVPVHDAAGRLRRWFGTGIDIDDRKREEQTVRRSEELFRAVFECSGTGIVLADAHDFRYLRVNRKYCELTGYSEEELSKLTFPDITHPDDRDRDVALFRRVLAGELPGYTVEKRYLRRDRQEIWVRLDVALVRDADGRPQHSVAVVQDITAAKRAAQLLDRYRLLSQFARDKVLFVRLDGRIVEANAAAVAAYGYNHDELLGLTIADLRDPATWPQLPAQIAEADRQGIIFETVHRRRDGSTFPVEVSARGAEVGGERLLLSVVRDITERKRAEAALREADRRKDEFLATLAHELRNPLAPIRNAVEVLRQIDPTGPDVRNARDVIGRQVQQLSRLVDDLLDVSRITRGQIELRRERVELAAVVERALETSRPLVEASGHRLTVALPSQAVWLDADPTRLAQVLANLLNNAAKYTRRGGTIELTAARVPGEVALCVRDNGIGIPADMLARVFDMFTQVDTALERAQGGLGIGLTVVRRLVEMHGGRVTAESAGPSTGCAFTVRLPLVTDDGGKLPAEGQSAPVHPHSAIPQPSLRVLIIDDNRDSADTLAKLLRMQHHAVRTAYDGPSGLDVAGEFRPDVVLLDIGMPYLSGYDVARELRRRPETQTATLVAMTGYGQDEDRRRSAEAGFDRHFVKPIDLNELKALLRDVAASR